MADWAHCFQFETGAKFFIDGPWGYNGHGRVLERTGQKLVLRLDIPAWGPAPEFKSTITAEYRQEGPGNTVILERDGTPSVRDDNAIITSDDARRERAISSRDITCSVRFEDDNEVDFDVNVNGQSWDFDLKRE